MEKFNRRKFLYGMNGLILAIPTLPSVFLPWEAKAIEGAETLRFFCVNKNYGYDHGALFKNPTTWDGQNPQEFYKYVMLDKYLPNGYSYILGQKFNPLLKKMTVIRGLDLMDYHDGHSASVPLSGAGDFDYTIDMVLEESAKFYPSPSAVGGIRYGSYSSALSISSKVTAGQRIRPEDDLGLLFKKLFDEGTKVEAEAARNHIAKATHPVYQDYKSLLNSRRISASDADRLTSYMDLLADTEKRLAKTTVVANCSGGGITVGQGLSETERNETAFNIQVAALACGLTKIVAHTIEGSGIPNYALHHKTAHRHNEYEKNSEYKPYRDINKYEMDRAADLLAKLDSITDANGKTLLDNTLVYICANDSTGRHTSLGIPAILAGATSVMNTGYFIDYSTNTRAEFDANRGARDRNEASDFLGRPYNNLLVSILQSFGLTPSDYKKFGADGFGYYKAIFQRYRSHYDKFASTPALKNQKLPFIFKS